MVYHIKQREFKNFEKMLTLNTDRFAVFNYAHVPWLMKTIEDFDETTFPQPARKTRDVKRYN